MAVLLLLLAANGLAAKVHSQSSTLAEVLQQPDWTFLTGGDGAWSPLPDQSRDGGPAGRSGLIGHKEESWLETTISAEGTLHFWWKVSSEKGFDFLEFSINGEVHESISGESDWARVSVPIGGGEETLRWRYSKDASITRGEDAAWLAELVFEPVPDLPLRVLPEEPWEITAFSRQVTNASRVYTLFRDGGKAAGWIGSSTVEWLDFAGVGQVGAVSEVTIRTNAQAPAQPVGVHAGELVFTDPQTGAAVIREVVLTILPRTGQLEVTDSIGPSDDLALPFGDLSLGLTRTATIRVANADPTQPLTIHGMQLQTWAQAQTSLVGGAGDDSDSFVAMQIASPVAGAGNSPVRPHPDWTRDVEARSILVRFKRGAPAQERAAVHGSLAGKVRSSMRRIPLDVVEIPSQADPRAMVAAYQRHPQVEYAEPNYRLSSNRMPNDPRFSDQWALQNTGQNQGLVGADIGVRPAWRSTLGSEEIVVAVIDSGIDYTHPDLAANMWINPAPTFGDIHGARWTGGNGTLTSGDPMDDDGHGTHVAGILGAVGNNGTGITGVTWNVRLMALKFLNADGFGSTADAIAALEYAIDKGAHITNNSWGGGGLSLALRDMIAAAGEANQLFVTAAGNRDSNNDIAASYPASFDLDNIISVASSNRNDQRAFLSNYGVGTVHLAAPGESIVSTIPGGGYQLFSGTSMAAPHVAGVAALILSLNPGEAYAEVKRAILGGVTPLPHWEQLVISGGRLDAGGALANLVPEFKLSGLPLFPLVLPPGRSLVIEVSYAPRAAGVHQASVVVTSDDLNHPTVEVLLSGRAMQDSLEILEEGGWVSEGFVSGPFDPVSRNYTLRNNGSDSMAWTGLNTASWLTINPSGGILAGDEEVEVEVSLSSGAQSLAAGTYHESVTFANRDSGLAQSRPVRLHVRPWPGRLGVTDSVAPEDDLLLPFGSVLPGEERTEFVTVANLHEVNDILIDEVLLLGGYREDFDQPTLGGWRQEPLTAWSLNENHYQAFREGTSLFMQATYREEVWSDGTFEAEFSRSGFNSSAAAMILRGSDDFNLDRGEGTAIVIGVSGNGFFFIARFINGKFGWIQPWTQSFSLRVGATPNRLVASLRDDQLHLFGNDQLLWSGPTGGPYRAGHFGLAGFNERSVPTTHKFGYVDVREPLMEKNLPLSLSQSWQNQHPVATDNYFQLDSESILPVDPVPTDKMVDWETLTYTEVVNRQETFRVGPLPSSPHRIKPGQTFDLPVLFRPSGEGSFARTLRMVSNDPDRPTVDLSVAGVSWRDPLTVLPLGTFVAVGELGGPFAPLSMTYTLRNQSSQPLEWELDGLPLWVASSKSSGVIGPDSWMDVSLSITSEANSLPRKKHTGSIRIVNSQTGFSRSIAVEVDVRPTLCQSLLACGLTWTTGGDVAWSGQARTTFRRDIAAQSGRIQDSEQSWVNTVVEGPGEISFWWTVSSEEQFDFLEFWVNGVRQKGISGEVGWEKVTAKLPAGPHQLRWKYVKDWISSDGADSGWLDEISWTPTPPQPRISTAETLSFGLVTMGDSVSQLLAVNNPGDSPLVIDRISFPLGFSGDWDSATIEPGATRSLEVTFAPEMLGTYAGVLQFTSNAETEPHRVQLEGSSAPAGQALEVGNNETLTALAAAQGEELRFVLAMPSARDWLEIQIFGGVGDADLYVRHGAEPSVDEFDFAPFQVGNNEKVWIERPAAGVWYFMMQAYENFSGVSLSARFPPLTLASWTEWLGLPEDGRGLMERHGPLAATTLVGYALGRDPRDLSSADLPRLERSPESPDQVRLLYRVQTAAPEVSLTLQVSPDLIIWEAGRPSRETVLSKSDGVEIREAIFETDGQNMLFIRTQIGYEGETME